MRGRFLLAALFLFYFRLKKIFNFDKPAIFQPMKFILLRILFILLCIFELLLISFLQNFAGPINSPVWLLITSIAIAILFYILTGQRNESNAPLQKNIKWKAILQIAVFISITILIGLRLHTVIVSHVMDTEDSSVSDVIPQTEILANRFLENEKVYQPIQFTGYALFPTYLPLQWMPYLFAEWMNLDYRWLAAIGLWIISLLFFIRYRRKINHFYVSIFISCSPLIIWYVVLLHDDMQFAFMLESLIAAYYLFAMMGLSFTNKIAGAVGFSLCLLSRYAIVLWMPFYFFYLLMEKNYRKFILTGAIIAVTFLVFYWLPFLRNDYSIFQNGYAYHTKAATGEWQHLNVENQPEHLFNGLGFAAWGYKFLPQPDIAAKLHTWQNIHLFISLAVVAMMGLIYYIRRNTIRKRPYLMMSLKIYLIVFYSFIQIPYGYLFLVPVIITTGLLAELFSSAGKASG